jgi:ATP adenylyltransferase
MDKLWAPWRVKYITKIGKPAGRCIFCQIFSQRKDRANYVIARTKHSFAVLNIYPYNNGHTLIVPNRHVSSLEKLTRLEREDLLDLLIQTQKMLDKMIAPAGYNVGINLGRVAGAGIPGHLHIHIVPRWRGDVNFMPVTAQTKVISQSLKALFDKITKARQKSL